MRHLLILCVLLLPALLQGQVPEVLYLKFNEGGSSLTTADDSLVGLPGLTLTLFNPGIHWGSGKLGAASFKSTGTSGPPYWSLNQPLQVSGDWTIEAWIRPDSFTSTYPLIFSVPTGAFELSGKVPQIDVDDLRLTGPFGEVVINEVLTPNAWKHLAIVNDTAEGTMTPYVDGVAGTPWLPTGPTDIAPLSAGSTSFIGGWGGEIDELRIWNRARTAAEIQACMNTELSAFASDLTVSAIRAPVFLPHATQLLGATETVTCEIMNVGTTTIAAGTTVQLGFSVNGQNAVSEMLTLSQALAPGDQLLQTFTATADLSATGPQSIQVTATMTGDLNTGNDLRQRSFGSDYGYLVNVMPWSEDFEGMPAEGDRLRMSYWFQELEPGQVPSWNPDWVFGEFQVFTGIGFLAGTNVSATAPTVVMRSPLLDLRTVGNPRLRFRLLSDQALDGNATGPSHFSLDIVSQPGDVITTVYSPVGDLGSGWKDIQIDLSAFAGAVIQLRPRLDNLSAVTRGHTVFIDDFLLTDHPVGQGQAPRPGLAVFDLNNSMNIGMNVPSYGEAGPYYTEAQAGDAMIFSFEGAPLQPVLLAAGPLNPIAATFPNIGQLDIGGPIDPMTGIPLGIFVLFDGNLPGPLNSFFLTDANGHSAFGFALPAFPPGPLATFQAVLRDPATGLLVIGNAIELMVN